MSSFFAICQVRCPDLLLIIYYVGSSPKQHGIYILDYVVNCLYRDIRALAGRRCYNVQCTITCYKHVINCFFKRNAANSFNFQADFTPSTLIWPESQPFHSSQNQLVPTASIFL